TPRPTATPSARLTATLQRSGSAVDTPTATANPAQGPTRTPGPTSTRRPTRTPTSTRSPTATVTPVPRPLGGGSRAIAGVAGASGRSVNGALTGRALLFGLTAVLPGATFTGLRVGDQSIREAELNKYDTLLLLGLCRLDLLDADERGAIRTFVASGGKLILRDSN